LKGIDRSLIKDAPDYCFIDGEHTAAAVSADFEFCLSVCRQDGVIVFHDDAVILTAIQKIMSSLKSRGIRFTARKFGGATFAVFLGDSTVLADPAVSRLSSSGSRWVAERGFADSAQRYVPEWALPPARHLYRIYKRFLGPASVS
jgi:hypothetical protein